MMADRKQLEQFETAVLVGVFFTCANIFFYHDHAHLQALTCQALPPNSRASLRTAGPAYTFAFTNFLLFAQLFSGLRWGGS